jgi:hypothetical protein
MLHPYLLAPYIRTLTHSCLHLAQPLFALGLVCFNTFS